MSSNLLTGLILISVISTQIFCGPVLLFHFYYNSSFLMFDGSARESGGSLREAFGVVGAEQADDLGLSDFRIGDDDLRAVDAIEADDGRSDRLVVERDLRKFGRWQLRG